MSKAQPFQINWLGATGSALGAVSSAILLSTLGAAGTLFGAALGSLIITVGGSIYTQSLQKTKARVQSKPRADQRPSQSPAPTGERSSGATVTTSPEPPEQTEEKPSKGLPWKRIIGLTVGLFVVVMAIILAFELSTGRPVSSFTGGTSATETGTTFTGLSSSSGVKDAPDADDPAATPTSTEQPTMDEPAKDEPKKEEPFEETPAEEKPVEEKPAEEKPVEEKPADPPAPADPEE